MADHKRLRVQAGQSEDRMDALADTRYAGLLEAYSPHPVEVQPDNG